MSPAYRDDLCLDFSRRCGQSIVVVKLVAIDWPRHRSSSTNTNTPAPSVPFCLSTKNSDSPHGHTIQTTIDKGHSGWRGQPALLDRSFIQFCLPRARTFFLSIRSIAGFSPVPRRSLRPASPPPMSDPWPALCIWLPPAPVCLLRAIPSLHGPCIGASVLYLARAF